MRDDLIRLLDRAVALGAITRQEADAIRTLYDRGLLPDDAVRALLPLPAAQAGIAVTESALGAALYRLHIIAGLTEAEARRAALGGLVRVVEGERARVLIRLTVGFEERTFGITRTLSQGGSVSVWQRGMMEQVRSEILGSAALGYGREPLPSELLRIQDILDREAGYLSRFADVVSSKRALAEATGNPALAMSEAAIRNRANQYAGAGRELFFRGMESRRGPGWVYEWVSRDDPAVCSRCLAAEQGGPYLGNAGPYPGTVCLARGRCRCRRVARFSPSDYARLTETRAAT